EIAVSIDGNRSAVDRDGLRMSRITVDREKSVGERDAVRERAHRERRAEDEVTDVAENEAEHERHADRRTNGDEGDFFVLELVWHEYIVADTDSIRVRRNVQQFVPCRRLPGRPSTVPTRPPAPRAALPHRRFR